jgi:hypothetical protein
MLSNARDTATKMMPISAFDLRFAHTFVIPTWMRGLGFNMKVILQGGKAD